MRLDKTFRRRSTNVCGPDVRPSRPRRRSRNGGSARNSRRSSLMGASGRSSTRAGGDSACAATIRAGTLIRDYLKLSRARTQRW